MRRLFAFVVLGVLAACGGGDTEADDDDDGQSSSSSSSSSSGGGGGGGGGGTSSSGSGTGTSSSSSGGATSSGGTGSSGAPATVQLPPDGTLWDYQIGVAYAPPPGVGIVSRDRAAAPAAGIYNICYINGFQAQPEENDLWLQQHPDLVLRDAAGKPVIDEDWNEMLLDISTADKRSGIAAVMEPWIAACAAAGFAAIEIDNLDSYTRSGDRMTEDDAVAMQKLFADASHAHGLALGQKNGAEMVGRRAEMGCDFAVVESCNEFDECDSYTAGYGTHVLSVEYRQLDLLSACGTPGHVPTVLRDLDLVGPGDAAYVYQQCP